MAQSSRTFHLVLYRLDGSSAAEAVDNKSRRLGGFHHRCLVEGAGTYDAFDLATNLGFRSTDHFLPEILVHGGIFADSYRILTVIRGTQEVTDAALSVEGLTAMVTLPRELVTGLQASILLGIHHLPDFSDRLRDEIYTHTGVRDELKFLLLLLTMANIPHLCESNGLDTTITCQPHGIGWHFEGVVH